MENNRKEQERAELHRTIWNMANDLRGSVDGWDFKQYVLGMLFTATYLKILLPILTPENGKLAIRNLIMLSYPTKKQNRHERI